MSSFLSATFLQNVKLIFTTKSYMDCVVEGLKTTAIVSLGATVLGLFLGTIVALVNLSSKKNKAMLVPRALCKAYVTVVRGTPMALQLFIMNFVIFAIRGFPMEVTAIIAFGVNSGAYVSENIRAGILSVDKGQMEAGRSLGLTAGQTMVRVVIPQAMKNVIPAIGNELIALIKETSIVSMIGMFDLTQAAKVIGSGNNLATYLAPMLVAAVFYLAIVYLLTLVVKFLERRLRAGDRR